MSTAEFLMPKIGESIMEVIVLSWYKSEGDSVNLDEPLLRVATDKVDVDIYSEHQGIVRKILVEKGGKSPIGGPLVVIETGENTPNASTQTLGPGLDDKGATATTQNQKPSGDEDKKMPKNEISRSDMPFYSPLVLKIARQEKISKEELASIEGQGKDGRVTKADVLKYLVEEKKKMEKMESISTITSQKPSENAEAVEKVDFKPGDDEVVEMGRVRKMISERMVQSKSISAHVTSFVEADVTQVVEWKKKNRNYFMEKHGLTLTFTPIFVHAIIKGLQDFPMINVQVENNRIIKKAHINIGLAVATPDYNTIVPVIHHADKLNLLGLTRNINDLTRRSRKGDLQADELAGGTFTVSNMGPFGSTMGTPIIMQPQVAIIALGTISKKATVIETPEGDAIAIRSIVHLSHSYDHRIIDGNLGGMFVRRVADHLEKFNGDQLL